MLVPDPGLAPAGLALVLVPQPRLPPGQALVVRDSIWADLEDAGVPDQDAVTPLLAASGPGVTLRLVGSSFERVTKRGSAAVLAAVRGATLLVRARGGWLIVGWLGGHWLESWLEGGWRTSSELPGPGGAIMPSLQYPISLP